ncbi:MAG: polysaccharide deacetylase family protein [Nanoarchaeota archaeon]|nr:polysaccharide deacetylase family protein [Nanoarchaeota archaeon]
MKQVLLTFDLEEFDAPLEFSGEISEQEQFETSKQGLLLILGLLSKYNIKATFFTTSNFAKHYPSLIKDISKKHEIACHGYVHSDSYFKDLSRIPLAKQEIEKIIKKQVHGFRAPRFEIKDISSLSDFGFSYDSSVNPTFIPGRYINLFKKRKPNRIGNITEFPLSALPIIRLPLEWLTFKNFPFLYSKIFTKINSLSSDYTMLIFHPWEFADLTNAQIPFFMKAKHSQKLLNKLEKYIQFCKAKGYDFKTIESYLNI